MRGLSTGYPLTFAHAATPKLYNFLVPYVFEWGAFRSEPAEKGPGNVFESMPEWNQVAGGWRDGGARIRRAALAGGATITPLLAWWLTRRQGRG